MAMAQSLSKNERRAMRCVTKAGRRGASARKIFPRDESVGLAIALRLVRRGLVVATSSNAFMLAKYANDNLRSGVIADDGGRTVWIDPQRPLPPRRPRVKPMPVDVSGCKITKLPDGEAYGARERRSRR
jgi:hypothetical protein